MTKRGLRIRCFLGAVVILLCCLLPNTASAVLKRGSSGDEVITLQKKLKAWGLLHRQYRRDLWKRDGRSGQVLSEGERADGGRRRRARNGSRPGNELVVFVVIVVVLLVHILGRHIFACAMHIWRGKRRALQGHGGGGSGDTQPCQEQSVP